MVGTVHPWVAWWVLYTLYIHPGIHTMVYTHPTYPPWVHPPCTSAAPGVSVAPTVVSEK